ncbi:MAG: 50S ribosomal protein L35 [Gemmatimonadales bacterium]|nr:50S ribosomal protein L35 [Gemmatimonadales bacterium]NIP06168.1 50S ribosomal protein L35 [Gemmatimonadales bacterium]
MSAKTHKGIRKRMKRTASGKVLRGRNYSRHLRSHKSAKRKRELRKWKELSDADRKRLERQYGSICPR